MPITDSDFVFVSELVRRHSAIALGPGKEYLVETRLAPLAREGGMADIAELVRHLRDGARPGLHSRVVEAMTTNETSFFRDVAVYNALERHVLPELARRPPVTIWSAACSSGQEPYSIALLLREAYGPGAPATARIMASDISREMLDRAQSGRYKNQEVNRGLPSTHLVKYFRRDGLEWELSAEVRSMVRFFEVNLAGSWPVVPPCDVVLLRNVLIYFDVPTRREILDRVCAVLRPGGLLVLGAVETTQGVCDGFERVQFDGTAFFRRKS